MLNTESWVRFCFSFIFFSIFLLSSEEEQDSWMCTRSLSFQSTSISYLELQKQEDKYNFNLAVSTVYTSSQRIISYMKIIFLYSTLKDVHELNA